MYIHDAIVTGGSLSPVARRNGELTIISPDLTLDHIYVTEVARKQLTVPTAFVVRPEHFAETGPQFDAACSDYLPVLLDYAIKQHNVFTVTANAPS